MKSSVFRRYWLLVIGYWLFGFSAFAQSAESKFKTDNEIKAGAARTELYLPLLKDKKVAVVANQTSVIGNTHLVDSLLALGVDVKKVFAPEHGFRGMADAGEHVKNARDKKTGLPVISLYGKNKKPSFEYLKDVDIVVFDIQDVGVRFYTYISTMHYVMQACAEYGREFLVLDRPNPNGDFIDGPMLEKEYQSFVGVHPIPLVHGLTVAELAQMINGEKWLKGGMKCDLKYILCENYSHMDSYHLSVKPSPNLPNMASVYLYPSLGLFEGTAISVGRGTDKPFQIIGHPDLENTTYSFKPKSMPGAKDPRYKKQHCNGFDLSEFGQNEMTKHRKLYLHWLIGTYQNYPDKENYFNKNGFFNLLAGNSTLQKQVKEGLSEKQIRQSWQEGLQEFKKIRKRYLLYEDFE
ncbi:MAG: hypothetical protein COA57_02580 [Flavobacteriales bacterium]|nr:MAG: hypothetical protein COA57_02580 [Flavobacteriales bacterium]